MWGVKDVRQGMAITDHLHVPGGAGPQSSEGRPATRAFTREQFLRQRTIVLDHRLEHDNAERIAADLLSLAHDDPWTDIVVLIDSSDGPVQAGLDIVEVIDSVVCDVVTYATGLVTGMGLFVLGAGTRGKRYALPHARVVMRRPPDSRVMTGKPPNADEIRKFPHDRGVRSALRQVALVTAEQTGRTIEQVLADMRAARSFTAEQARAYGFVDEVVPQCKPLTLKPPNRDRDTDGNSLLHHAYYSGNERVVEGLLALGADTGLRNRFGLTPESMANVRLAELQLLELAGLIDLGHHWGGFILGPPSASRRDRTWTDPGSAAKLCARLRRHDPSVYALALDKAVEAGELRAILRAAIKIGRPESLARLETLLDRRGTSEIATDYLNSGSPELIEAGRRWARKHFFEIREYFGGGGQSGWGTG
ncbi:ATP-dependent Clp protease proteolytic subunit [Nonomuraea sp. B12E4]|uniref:ClpP family protease n=1 Tax=Nonomuraea sp. B12E4 TaxID=3153564 RepID=UPI00325F744A